VITVHCLFDLTSASVFSAVTSVTAVAMAPHAVLAIRFTKMFVSMAAFVTTACLLLLIGRVGARADSLPVLLLRQLPLTVCWHNILAF
jgi:hypothetical protein